MRARRILGLWGPVAAYMLLLSLSSSRSDIGSIPGNWDKVVHTLAYAVLGLLAMRAFHGGLRTIRAPRAVGAVLLTVVYGMVDEFHQSFVPGRVSSVADWGADLVGALLAVAVVGALVVWRQRRRQTAGSEAVGRE